MARLMSYYQDTKPALNLKGDDPVVLGDITGCDRVKIKVARYGTGFRADVTAPTGKNERFFSFIHFSAEAPTEQYAVDLCIQFVRKNNPNCHYEVSEWS